MTTRRCAIVLVAAFLTACAHNRVEKIPLSELSATEASSTIVAFGLEIDAEAPNDQYGVQLTKYDPIAGELDAGCWVFDRIDAYVAAPSHRVEYFGFRVPAGNYGLSPFLGFINRVPLDRTPPRPRYSYFEATAGKLLYLGDFVFETHHSEFRGMATKWMSLAIESDAGRMNRFQERFSLPSNRVALAEWKTAAKPPHMFLCTP